MSYLEKVNSPADLKKLSLHELKEYAEEVREYIVEVVEKNGGHLASNLGAVELTIALHYVFDCPEDKFIFDVGHQSYTHKIITGRRDDFRRLRCDGGVSGFENMRESICDAFTTGHSSTSLSVGLGMARARDIAGEKYNVISVIGDGAFTGGMTYEALNDIGESGTRMLIVLNDNTMSISKNVGAMSTYFKKLRLSRRYKVLKTTFKRGIDGIPILGPTLVKAAEKVKLAIKKQVDNDKMFDKLGIKYYGAFDGHDIGELVYVLSQVKHLNVPVLVHVVTRKGSGLYEAERDPVKYHGITGEPETALKFSEVAGNALCSLAEKDPKIVGVSAAMLPSTGLEKLKNKFPERCFDVGIAEQHSVSMCAGLAASGFKPYFAVYSSFLQRAFDQILHDVCINSLPVRFLIDRAGAVGSDGVTHQGLFDLSYLTVLPEMCVAAPRNGKDLQKLIDWSAGYNKGPLAIRYPKGYSASCDDEPAEIEYGKWEIVRESENGIYAVAVGPNMTEIALAADCGVVSARFVKPFDTDFIEVAAKRGDTLITLEENSLSGGFGESVLGYVNGRNLSCRVINLGFSDKFCDKRTVAGALAENGLTAENLSAIIKNIIAKKQ